MAVREYGARSNRWRQGGAQWGPFDGGLNLRDQYLDVAPNELISGTNLTLDERGETYKRNHCPASASFPSPPAGTIASSFFSSALGLGIIQIGTQLYKAALGAGSWTTFGSSLGSSEPAVYADFLKGVVVGHPAGGVGYYDGTTFGFYFQPDGFGVTCVAGWQNKVFVSGGPVHPTRVWWSKPGDPTDFTSAAAQDFNDLREKDDKPIKALFPSSGLLAFKEDSTYRIDDSSTGSYKTIDWNAGCVGPNAVTATNEGIFFWGLDGLYKSNGIGPAVNAGDRVRPLFTSSLVNSTTKPKISAETLNNRIYFAYPGVSSTITDAILEYNPRVGWCMVHDLGGSEIGTLFAYLNASGIRRMSFTLGSAAIKDAYTSTTLTSFAFDLQTSWIEPFGPAVLSRLQRLMITGLFSAVTFPLRVNYMTESGTTGIGAPNWQSSFTPAVGFQPGIVRPLVQGRAFQLQISDSTPTPSGNFRIFEAQILNEITALR